MRRAQRDGRAAMSERFHQRYEFDALGGCWLWTGAMVHSTGYGTIEQNGRTLGAHRVSYELHKGPIPKGLQVCHKCDVRACVNPDHLFLGTASDNAQDMHRKGRANNPIGDAHAKAKITERDIPKILARLLIGHSCAEIAADYGVTDCAINAIRRGKSWTHVTGLPKTRGSSTTREHGQREGLASSSAVGVG
jgi:hypothetical protein